MTNKENNNRPLKNEESITLTLWDIFLIIVVLLIIIFVLGIYMKYFPNEISTDHDSWGQFGDYFGGVLNPILGFFTIVLLIITLRISFQTLKISKEELDRASKTLDLAKEATEKQVRHLELEAKKNELARIIKECDLEILEIFNKTPQSLIQGAGTFGDVFSSTSTIKVSEIRKYSQLTDPDKFNIARLIVLLANIDNNILLYKKISEHSVFTQHYQQKFYTSASKFKQYVPPEVFTGYRILGKTELLKLYNTEQFINDWERS